MLLDVDVRLSDVIDEFDANDILDELDDEDILDYAKSIGGNYNLFKSENPSMDLVWFIENQFPQSNLITKEQVLEKCKELLENTKLL